MIKKISAVALFFVACLAIMASGAFNSVTAERVASINVVGDGAALLSFSPADGPNGSYANIVNGKLCIDIPNMNAGASAIINDVFTVTNSSSSSVRLEHIEHGDNTGNVWFIRLHYIGVTLGPGESYTESMALATQELSPGDNILQSVTFIATVVE